MGKGKPPDTIVVGERRGEKKREKIGWFFMKGFLEEGGEEGSLLLF
jgi:hypothetical protein